MVATVADTLFNRLIDAFPADRAYRPTDFSRDPMPGPLQDYLKSRLNLHLDDAVPPETSWFDVGHADVREATRAYRNALAKHMRIPASEWRGELATACRTVASFLIRPAGTLTDLIFESRSGEASLEDITDQLRLLPAYTYFGDVIEAYFEQKELERIGKERFLALAERIDHQMVRDFGADEWVKLLQPLMDVVRQIPEFSNGIPIGVLKTFFEEKKANELAARLEARSQSEGFRFVLPAELRDLVERLEEEPARKADLESAESHRPARKQEGAHHDSHVPLWKQFESGLQSPHQSESASRGDAAPPGKSEAQPLWKQYHGTGGPQAGTTGSATTESRSAGSRPSASHSSIGASDSGDSGRSGAAASSGRSDAAASAGDADVAEAPDQLSMLERSVLGSRGRRNRELFLRHLFSGSTEAYESTLRKLDTAESWSEASQIIAREVFLKHQVNIYSDHAVAFTDAAEARYRS